MKQGLNHNVTSYINSNATSMPVSSYQPDYRVIKCEISASAISSDSQVSTTQTAVGSYVAHGSLSSSIFGNLEFPLYPLFLLVIRSYLYTLPGLVSCSAGKIGGVITLHIILDTHQIFHTFRQNAAFFNHCKSEDGSVMTNDHHSLRLQISCMCICLLFLFSV